MNYEKHYGLLIERARARTIEGYSEEHHVVPKCLGGSNDPLNLVSLTPEEHYLAHQLLFEMNPDNVKLLYAVTYMCAPRNQGLSKNKMYGWLRRKLSLVQSEKFSGRVWTDEQNRARSEAAKNNWQDESIKARMLENMSKPRNWSEDTLKRHSRRTSEMLRELWKDPSYREKRIAKMKGRKMTDEQRAAVSKRMSARTVSEESIKKMLETRRLNKLKAEKELLRV